MCACPGHKMGKQVSMLSTQPPRPRHPFAAVVVHGLAWLFGVVWAQAIVAPPQQSRANRAAWGHAATQQCPTTGTRGEHGFREAEVSAGMVPALSSSPSPSHLANMLKCGCQSQCQPSANGEVGTSSSPVTYGPACQTLQTLSLSAGW